MGHVKSTSFLFHVHCIILFSIVSTNAEFAAGMLKVSGFTLTWLRNLQSPLQARMCSCTNLLCYPFRQFLQEDLQSPHTWVVTPSKDTNCDFSWALVPESSSGTRCDKQHGVKSSEACSIVLKFSQAAPSNQRLCRFHAALWGELWSFEPFECFF